MNSNLYQCNRCGALIETTSAKAALVMVGTEEGMQSMKLCEDCTAAFLQWAGECIIPSAIMPIGKTDTAVKPIKPAKSKHPQPKPQPKPAAKKTPKAEKAASSPVLSINDKRIICRKHASGDPLLGLNKKYGEANVNNIIKTFIDTEAVQYNLDSEEVTGTIRALVKAGWSKSQISQELSSRYNRSAHDLPSAGQMNEISRYRLIESCM